LNPFKENYYDIPLDYISALFPRFLAVSGLEGSLVLILFPDSFSDNTLSLSLRRIAI